MNQFFKYTILATAASLLLAAISFNFVKADDFSNLNLYFQNNLKKLNAKDVIDLNYEQQFEAADLKNVKVKLTFGDAQISPSTDDKIHVKITAKADKTKSVEMSKHIFTQDETLEINLTDAFTEITSVQSQMTEGNASVSISNSFVLEIKIPKTIQLIDINTISADWNISESMLNQLHINNVSGDIKILKSSVDHLKAVTISGELELQLEKYKDVDLDSVSGDIELALKDKAQIKMNTVSGEIEGLNKFSDDKSPLKIRANTVSGDVEFR